MKTENHEADLLIIMICLQKHNLEHQILRTELKTSVPPIFSNVRRASKQLLLPMNLVINNSNNKLSSNKKRREKSCHCRPLIRCR